VDAAQFPVWTTLALGFVLGLRHALDADHPAAGLFSLGFGLHLIWTMGLLEPLLR
jgi:hypothetical protein